MLIYKECRRGDSHPLPTWYCLCIVSSPGSNRYIFLYERSSDSSFDSLCCGVPPKSPYHQDMNPSSISTQTHQEERSPTMSEDVWHCKHPPERSSGMLAPPQRCDTGADTLLLIESVLIKRSHARPCACRTRTASSRAEARVPRPMRRPSSMVTIILLPPTRETPLPANARFLERP